MQDDNQFRGLAAIRRIRAQLAAQRAERNRTHDDTYAAALDAVRSLTDRRPPHPLTDPRHHDTGRQHQ